MPPQLFSSRYSYVTLASSPTQCTADYGVVYETSQLPLGYGKNKVANDGLRWLYGVLTATPAALGFTPTPSAPEGYVVKGYLGKGATGRVFTLLNVVSGVIVFSLKNYAGDPGNTCHEAV